MSNDKLDLTQAASMCLLGVEAQATDEGKVRLLKRMMLLSYNSGAKNVLLSVKENYRKQHPGMCRMYSQGGLCDCHLCFIDRLLEEVYHET